MSAPLPDAPASRRVLVVDDDRDFAESLTLLLDIEGYDVRSAHDRQGALAALDAHGADVALVDLRLGGDDGLDTVRALRARRPDVVCVIVTAHASAETAIDALHGGVQDYLTKPFRAGEVTAVVSRCFERIDLARETAATAEALRESEARFRDFAETAADWFWETDEALRFTYVSGRYEALTGVPRAEMLGLTPVQFLARPDPEDSALEVVLADMQARRPFEGVVLETVQPGGLAAVHSVSGRPVFDEAGEFHGYRGTGRDITEEHELSRELTFHAAHDALTGLVNRREFETRLRRVLDTSRRASAEHALLYLDLDQFKVVNDTSGHVAGDELLRQLAAVLAAVVRKRDTFARLGGDEFGALLEHCSIEQAERVAGELRETVEGFRFVWESRTFSLGVSIGLVPITDASRDVTDVLKVADAACYVAKERGRNRIHVWRPDDRDLARRHGDMQWVARVGDTLENDRLTLYFQNIVPVAAPAPGGPRFELLLRMIEEDGTVVPPGGFLPAAERYDVISRIDRWVLDRALDWLESGGALREEGALCFINLSGQSVGDAGFLAFAEGRLRESGLPPERIGFEITETAAISNLAGAIRFIRALGDRGCCFALDDFGSGVSSYAYLRTLPVDFLKIDGGIVGGIDEDPVDLAMVRSIHDVGHLMGKRTIAEWVESDVVLERLREIGVDYAQGYALHRPEPLDRLG